MSRKRIALVTINPEDESFQRILDGILAQSVVYNYDVCIVAPLVHVAHYFKDYRDGELKIYDILNFDLFDGVIITPIPMREEQVSFLTDALLMKFKKECHIPVVSINEAFGDYPVVVMDESDSMEAIAEHLISIHGVTDIAILTGPKDYHISDERVAGVRRIIEAHGLTLPEEHIYNGNFWYDSGETLAEQIASGEIARPQAVICASDHMAIGLVCRLEELGINVPDDIIVTGNGGVREAFLSVPPITTFEPDEQALGYKAVDYLHSLIQPDMPTASSVTNHNAHLCIGGTCGCPEDTALVRKKIRNYMYSSAYNSRAEQNMSGIPLTTLLDSYISEMFTAKRNVYECLCKIYESIYLLKPYGYFYLCLNSDWLDTNTENKANYPDTMYMAIYSDQAKKLHGYINHVFWGKSRMKPFSTHDMLPAFSEDFDTPQVYYFTPLHINEETIGYAVLQNDCTSTVRISNVYRNYLRYVNNALEMSRAKNYILDISEHDQLTNLYNRHGMERIVSEWNSSMSPDLSYMAIMIDMNNLKMINDSLGHDAGDLGIKVIAKAVSGACQGDEVAIRAGGDEFYLLGIGQYTQEDALSRINNIRAAIAASNQSNVLNIPYSAAMGAAIMKVSECPDLHKLLEQADVEMYVDKRKSRQGRI